MNHTNSIEQRKNIFLENSKKIHGDTYDYSKVVYTRAQEKVEIICREHGSFWQVPDAHRLGRGCPTCGRVKCSRPGYAKLLTLSQFIAQCRKHHGDFYSYEKTKYTGKVNPVIITCPIHGDFTQKAENHKNGAGCIKCGISKAHTHFRATTEEFIRKSKKIHGDTYDYSKSEYKGKDYPINITCKNPAHGDFTLGKANWHYLGHKQGCPKCSMSGTSTQEQEIAKYIQSLDIEIIQNDRSLISPLEIDIVIPSLKIAIEYCGLYWHSEQRGKDKDYHLNKLELTNSIGYRLITIMEDEWVNRQDIVKSRLKHILGKDTDKRLFARKLEIKKVSSAASREFFDEYHIQGTCGASWMYGLFDKEKMVACISFGINRFTKEAGCELIRYATSYNIVGGFSRLLKHFIRENPTIKSISSYSCRRWSEGNVYSKNGFELGGTSQPSYFYIKPGETIRYNRVLFQRHKLSSKLENFDESKTEVQNMIANGYSRIFDCGCLKWILNL